MPYNSVCACAASIASYPWGEDGVSGRQEQWFGNTCIAGDPSHFFTWYECNATHPRDGTIPFPLRDNTYLSATGGYAMDCHGERWNLTQAQAMGVDEGSTTGPLPTAGEVVAMGRALLQF